MLSPRDSGTTTTDCLPKHSDRKRHQFLYPQRAVKFLLGQQKQCCNLRLNAKLKRSPYVAQAVKFPLPTQTDLINLYWCFQLVLITVPPPSLPSKIYILHCNQFSYLDVWLKSFTKQYLPLLHYEF